MRKALLCLALSLPLFSQNAALLPAPHIQFTDAAGRPLALGKIYTCVAGTSCPGNPLATYTDATAVTQNANPIILDAGGYASVWIGTGAYKLVAQNALGVQQWTQDGVTNNGFAVGQNVTALKCVANGLACLDGSAFVPQAELNYTQAGTGAVNRTIQNKLQETVSVKDFGAVGDGTTDDTAAINAAINAISFNGASPTAGQVTNINNTWGGRIVFPKGTYRYTSTLYVPSNVTLEGIGQQYFATLSQQQGGAVLYFNPASSPGTQAAVSGLIYNYSGGVYSRNSSITYTSDGADMNAGTVTSCAVGIKLINLSITTSAGVGMGLRWVGTQGGETRSISIGTNDANAPLVGMVSSAAWGSKHYSPNILALNQGFVAVAANGGAAMYNGYINRAGGSSGNSASAQTFAANISTGATGAMVNGGEYSFYSLTVEHWWLPLISMGSATVAVTGFHQESTGGLTLYPFDVAGQSSLSVRDAYAAIAAGNASSAFVYLQNETQNQNVIRFDGFFPFLGYPLIATDGASTSVVEFANMNENQMQFGTLPVGLEANVRFDHILLANTVFPSYNVYLNQQSGNDANYGIKSGQAVLTLSRAFALARLYHARTIFITGTGNLSVPSGLTMQPDLSISSTNVINFDFGGTNSLLYQVTGKYTNYFFNIGFTNVAIPLKITAYGVDLTASFDGAVTFALSNQFLNFASVTGRGNLIFSSAVTISNTMGAYAGATANSGGVVDVYCATTNRPTGLDGAAVFAPVKAGALFFSGVSQFPPLATGNATVGCTVGGYLAATINGSAVKLAYCN